MGSKQSPNMVTDMRCRAEHNLIFAMNSNIFQAEEIKPQYSIIPVFSRRAGRSEAQLSSYMPDFGEFVKIKDATPCMNKGSR
jgi:hypothetical protein